MTTESFKAVKITLGGVVLDKATVSFSHIAKKPRVSKYKVELRQKNLDL